MKTRKLFVPTLLVISFLVLVFWPGKARPTEAQLQPTSVPTRNDPSRVLSPSSTLFNYQGQLLDANGDPIDDRVEMAFGLYDQEAGGTPFWTEAYTGTQAITVTNGLFHALLGSVTPIDTTDFTGDIYLGLTVNEETLAPRELLTSVAYAVEATTLPDGAVTRGSLAISGVLDMDRNYIDNIGAGNAALEIGQDTAAGNLYFDLEEGNAIVFRDSTITGSPVFFVINKSGNIATYGTLDMNGNSIKAGAVSVLNPDNDLANVSLSWLDDTARIRIGGNGAGAGSGLDIQGPGNTSLFRVSGNGNVNASGNVSVKGTGVFGTPGQGEGGEIQLVEGTGGVRWYMDNYNNTLRWFSIGPGGVGGTTLIEPDGDVTVSGNMTCGGLVEANLQTAEELEAGSIDRFEEGDVLCWGMDQLELCSIANDRLVQAVADGQGRPIVLGAEAIKVLGPVKRGDILVASNVPGYAMVDNDPISGSVIAQALEDFDGESGLIKAMIRKW